MLDALPAAATLIADRGCDSRFFREALAARGIAPCNPSSKSCEVAYSYDKGLYCERHKVEVMFGRLKDWRRIATRYDRLADNYLAGVALVAAATEWANESPP